MVQNIPGQRKPGQQGGQHVSNWKNKKTLSAAEQVAQQYTRQGNVGGGGGGSNKSGCPLSILMFLAGVSGAVYGITQLFG